MSGPRLATADYAQEMRVTAHAGCPMERRSVKRPTTTSTSHALWDRCHILRRESILRHRMMHMTGMGAQREQSPGDDGKILQQVKFSQW